ncbi:MAG: acylphosphatase [Saprospiraceae bacterium]
MAAKRLIIQGKVQGVWYRATARKMAEELGLTGYVRNLPDGAVEAFVQGREDQLMEFEAWCKMGPPLAQVSQVSVATVPEDPGYGDFSILR